MKPSTEILLSAAFALTPEENWTQGESARDIYGQGLRLGDDYHDGHCWCLDGALRVASNVLDLTYSDYRRAYEYVTETVGKNAFEWNDEHEHAEVLDALYRAAELSEST